jgi:regulator of cell morphogenesis and NO signaling
MDAITGEEIENERTAESHDEPEWETRPLGALIDHIVGTYHAELARGLPRITGWAAQVLNAHGAQDLERYTDLRTVLTDLSIELSTHMMKEEQVLFPWIRQGNGRTAGEPIRVMNAEHEAAAEALARIRELTFDFTLPDYACPTMEALWAALEKLDTDLRAHIHLENNILFPRALAE